MAFEAEMIGWNDYTKWRKQEKVLRVIVRPVNYLSVTTIGKWTQNMPSFAFRLSKRERITELGYKNNKESKNKLQTRSPVCGQF